MDVCIIGAGYVGLVTGACLAEAGHAVVCVDRDADRVRLINDGQAPMHEPGLAELLARHVGRRLLATTHLTAAVQVSDLTMIAVGTPVLNGRIDLSQVEQAARQVGGALREMNSYHMVVLKSTVVPGTTEGLVRRCLEEASGWEVGRDIGLGVNPEFLTEGRAVEDFVNPDRLVLGGVDARSRDHLALLYAHVDAEVPRLNTPPATAEMIKYCSNALLATMISFTNEISRLCEVIGGIDAVEVMRGVHESAYLSLRDQGRRLRAPIADFLMPGCGFGGSCLPKDMTALVGQGAALGLTMPLLRSVLQVNQDQPRRLMQRIRHACPELEGLAVTVLGLSFKPDTDDLRESPALGLIWRLRVAGARLTVYDPVVRVSAHPQLRDLAQAPDLAAAIAGADVVVLVTRWEEFRSLPDILQDRASPPLVVDGRRLLDPDSCSRYSGVGQG